MTLTVDHLFDLSPFDHRDLFAEGEPPWTALGRLDAHLRAFIASCRAPDAPYRQPPSGRMVEDGGAWFEQPEWILIGRNVRIEPGAMITGPAVVDDGAVIGHGARLRGPALVSRGAIVGHCSEVKNSILFPRAKAPHFNGVYDSIIGTDANLGAGVVLPNVHAFGKTIRVQPPDTHPRFVPKEDTGLRKFGALVGDGAFIGCHAVTYPGMVAPKGSRIIV